MWGVRQKEVQTERLLRLENAEMNLRLGHGNVKGKGLQMVTETLAGIVMQRQGMCCHLLLMVDILCLLGMCLMTVVCSSRVLSNYG